MPRQHQWVRHSITPIVVISNFETDEPEIITKPGSKSQTAYGCHACSVPLDKETLKTECPGEEVDQN